MAFDTTGITVSLFVRGKKAAVAKLSYILSHPMAPAFKEDEKFSLDDLGAVLYERCSVGRLSILFSLPLDDDSKSFISLECASEEDAEKVRVPELSDYEAQVLCLLERILFHVSETDKRVRAMQEGRRPRKDDGLGRSHEDATINGLLREWDGWGNGDRHERIIAGMQPRPRTLEEILRELLTGK